MIRVVVIGITIYLAGADSAAAGAVSCFASELEGGSDEDESLELLQRRARSFQLFNSSEAQSGDGAQLLNHSWPQPLATLATDALSAVRNAASDAHSLGDWLFSTSRRSVAAWILGLWVSTVGVALSCMMYSVLRPPLPQSPQESDLATDRQDVTKQAEKKKAQPDILETALSVNVFGSWTFTWLDSFLAAPGPHLALVPNAQIVATNGVPSRGDLPRVRAASLWNMLQRAVAIPFTLLSIAWLVAFLELVAMVLILDCLLLIYEHRPLATIWTPQEPLEVTLTVLLLLFVLPLLYRYFSGLLSMVDGLQVAMVSSEMTSMLYQKALRLPIGSSYHGHQADEQLTGWQVAQALVEGIVQEWPLMIRSLALFTAAPCMACILFLLLVLHLQILGLVGFLLLIPGALMAFLLVKCAISQRRSYQHWQSERLRFQKLQGDGPKMETMESIMNARHSELLANQWYSVMMALLAGGLHAVVWLVVVASLYLATLKENLSARNWWLMLQMVTSLQTCGAWIFTGIRRAWPLPKSLKQVECFLEQPEMPRDVVRRPLTAAPEIARISGSFSFEEGGPTVLRDLDFSLPRGHCVALCGPAGSGKSALLMALLGELFPCGLACVSSTSKRCFLRSADALLLESADFLDVELILMDCGKAPDPAVLRHVARLARQRGAALLFALEDAAFDAALLGVEIDDIVRLRQGHMVLKQEAKEPAVHGQPNPDAERTPLKVLGDALLAMDDGGSTGLASAKVRPGANESLDGVTPLWSLALAYMGTAGFGNMVLVLFLVFAQRSFQLLQFLFLATWSDAVALDPLHVDHKSFVVSIVVCVGINTALLTLSEWAGSRATMTAGLRLQERQLSASDLNSVDSVLSGWLGCLRSILGSVLQQSYILLIAPQWLAVTLLLPTYLCIASFAWIYLRAAVHLALQGEDCFQHARQILSESLVPDPVQVRANHLQRSLVQCFTAQMRSMANVQMVLSAGCKSWLSFRVTFCVAFAAACCVLQVLLGDHQIGVGTLGLVISLLFALTNDIDFACDSCVQGCRALAALQRLGADSVHVESVAAAADISNEPMEVAKEPPLLAM